MKLTKAIWNKCSSDDTLKFCIDLKQKKIFFLDFNIDHFVYAIALVGKDSPKTRDELFNLLDCFQDRIVGGTLIKEKARFVCLLGISGIEYELKPANKNHSEKAINMAAEFCSEEFSQVNFIHPLAINKAINGQVILHREITN